MLGKDQKVIKPSGNFIYLNLKLYFVPFALYRVTMYKLAINRFEFIGLLYQTCLEQGWSKLDTYKVINQITENLDYEQGMYETLTKYCIYYDN